MSELTIEQARAALRDGQAVHFAQAAAGGALHLAGTAPGPRELLALLKAAGGQLVTGRLRIAPDGDDADRLVVEASRPDLDGLAERLAEQLPPFRVDAVLPLAGDEDDEEDEDEDEDPIDDDDDDWGDLFGDDEADDGADDDDEAAAAAEEDAADAADEAAAAAAWELAVAQARRTLPALDAPTLGQAMRKVLAAAQPGDTLPLLWAPGGPAGSVLWMRSEPPSPAQVAALLQALVGEQAGPPAQHDLDAAAAEVGLQHGALSAPDGRLVLSLEHPQDPALVASLTETWSRFVPQLGSCRRVGPTPPATGAPSTPDPTAAVAALRRLSAELRQHQMRLLSRPWRPPPPLPVVAWPQLSTVDAHRVDGAIDHSLGTLATLLDAARSRRPDISDPARAAMVDATITALAQLQAELEGVRAQLPATSTHRTVSAP